MKRGILFGVIFSLVACGQYPEKMRIGQKNKVKTESSSAKIQNDSYKRDMKSWLISCRTAKTVVMKGSNVAVVCRTKQGGINYFYNEEIMELKNAAIKLGVYVYDIGERNVAIPTYPKGFTPGDQPDDILRKFEGDNYLPCNIR